MSIFPKHKEKYAGNRLTQRAGQVLVICGISTLVWAGLLQPRIEAIRSKSGVYIPNAHYQFTAQEVEVQGKILSHTFTLYNGRGQPLLVEASADCGCTGLSWRRATLPPFGRKQITAKMTSSNHLQNVGVTFTLDKKGFVFADLKNQ